MACFLVPAAEAVVVTIVKRAVKKEGQAEKNGISFAGKLGWLSNMLWGGSLLLAFEHLWHGEITPWFPFLTAAADPASRAEMFFEMSTAGVLMALFVTLAWAGMVLAARALEKRQPADAPAGR